MSTEPADVIGGRARWCVVQGDSLALLRDLPTGSVEAVITDMPYSSGGQFRGDRTARASDKYVMTNVKLKREDFSGDNRDQRSFGYWCSLWLSECLRVARGGAPICLFTDWRQLPTTTDALQAGGWVWRGIAVWDKTEGCRPSRGRFAAQTEFVVWGSSGPMPAREDVGCLPGVFRHFPKRDDKHHIAGKPTPVMEQIVGICPPDGVVLDPFAGSATTGVAAIRKGRRFIGCDIGEHWTETSRVRLEAEAAGVSLQAAQAGQAPLFGERT